MALVRLREFYSVSRRPWFRGFRYNVNRAIATGPVMVGCGSNSAGPHARQRSDPFDESRPTYGVADSPFVGNDGNIPQNVGNTARFSRVACKCSIRAGIYVVDFVCT